MKFRELSDSSVYQDCAGTARSRDTCPPLPTPHRAGLRGVRCSEAFTTQVSINVLLSFPIIIIITNI